MGNVGRFFCVALPFILTAASIICMLIVGLTGVTKTAGDLYMFRVNLTDLSISPASIASIADTITSRSDWHDSSVLGTSGSSTPASGSSSTTTSSAASASTSSVKASDVAAASKTSNITASDLTLDNLYDVTLWGFCSTDSDGTQTCTKSQFDWASSYLNTSSLTSIASATGVNVTLPTEVTDSLKAFKAVAKWTEIVYVIAMLALGLELILGFFSYCSRAVSCVTYLLSGIATAAVMATAAMVTAMSVVVIGVIKSTAKYYGVTGSLNSRFLAVAWLAVAFAMASSLFWLFSACCCKREHHSRSPRHGNRDVEKPFLPSNSGSYAPIGDHQNNHGAYNSSYGNNHHNNNARSNLAYEPYSHANV